MDVVGKCGLCEEQFSPKNNIYRDSLIKSTIYKCPSCGELLVQFPMSWKDYLKLACLLLVSFPPIIFSDFIWKWGIEFGLAAAILAATAYVAPLTWVFFKLAFHITPIEVKESIYVPYSESHNK